MPNSHAKDIAFEDSRAVMQGRSKTRVEAEVVDAGDLAISCGKAVRGFALKADVRQIGFLFDFYRWTPRMQAR
jgi:hypothetical protein